MYTYAVHDEVVLDEVDKVAGGGSISGGHQAIDDIVVAVLVCRT